MCVPAPSGDTSPPTFVATAEGFMIELIGDNGSSASGYGTAQLRLPDRMEHRVRTIIMDPSGRTLLRHNTVVPSTERTSLVFRIAEGERGARFISGERPSRISVDDLPPVSGDAGVYVDSDTPHVVTVHDDASLAVFEIGPQQGTFPQPTTAAARTEAEPWIAQLAKALQSPDSNAARRVIQDIIPTTPEAIAICGFVSEELFRKPARISFNKINDTVNEIQCVGYDVTAAVDNGPPYKIAAGGSVQVPGGHSVTLTAATLSTGRAVASCCLHNLPPDKNLDELLVARLLETFERHSTSSDKVVSELLNITSSQSSNGQRLLPLLVDCLRRLPSHLQRPIYLGTAETPENTQLFLTLDDRPPIQLSPHTTTEVPRETNKICVSLHRSTLPVQPPRNELAKALVNTFYLPSPPPLPVRWGSIPTEVPEERALLDLLLQLIRDHENELARQRAQGFAAVLTDALQFTCEGGCLKNVRTERPCRLSVDVDGTGFMNVEQGGQIPQGYAFPPGSVHRVHILARDPISGAPCAETQVTLMAPEAVAMPKQVTPSVSCFLDASVLQLQEEVQLRLVCPPNLRIVSEVDGNGGENTGKAEFVARMSSARPHNVKVRLIDDAGGVVFEQRLALPPMMAPLWSLGLENASLQVDAVNGGGGGTIVKASLDRSPERDLIASLPFDSNAPHTILLRRYFVGQETLNTYAGELTLRIPAFVNPAYVEDVARVYRNVWSGGNGELRTRLTELRSRIPSSVVKELISALIESLAVSHAVRGNDSDVHIHFRLSGDESSFAR
ncbi:hypothetical protein TRSC58_03798 [Trypanosoma rangeli SC58]|uniref:Uncharacterized protein n=1 Tax=Trypanosoma rangeli SC58 TaxID=429131 RepID=A0A061J0P2_TRYRA|nr:hypothetical protein TRSC58_03798 [Trypanosoma rangeli SC58]